MSDSRNVAASPHDDASNIGYVDDPSVVVRDVYKTYAIGRGTSEDAGRFKFMKPKNTVGALKGVSFVATPGESIGVIGLNGSGKSTLLRMISGGEAPTSGDVRVSSRPTLLGVSPALQGDLTGEQNIYLGCLALGMTREEAKEQIDFIAEWTELGDAVKRPMMTYSSGMSARLSFAISTAVEPEILLIDEALSTGDAAFGAKAEERINGVIKNSGNFFLVSHSVGMIQRLCGRSLWIYQGEVITDGPTQDVVPKYHEWARLMGKDDKQPAHDYLAEIKSEYRAPVIIFD